MRYKLLLLFTLSLLAFLPNAFASPVNVSISPTSQVVSQLSSTTFAVGLANPGPHNGVYSLSLSGLSGQPYQFSSNPVPVGAGGTGGSSLTISTNNLPGLYCPGVYPFTVTATNATGSDSGSASATITVVQLGPPLSVTVSTDKAAYRIGDKITISISANRPAEGLLTISPPSGAPSTFPYLSYGPSYSVVKTLTAGQPIGRWTVSFQADDFCAGFSSSTAYFDVTPDTYDVSLSLSGVPPSVSVGIQVDGASQGNMTGSEIKALSFKIDTTHTITVDQTVAGGTGIQFFCSQNTWSVSSTGSRTFTYQTQYFFTVGTNPDGVAQLTGGGWFPAGATAQTSQAPATVAGGAGTQYVLTGWMVDGASQTGNSITMTMDNPHKAIATYETQYQLVVDSQYGDPKGAGYYAAGSTAPFSVTTPVGILIQQVFVSWNGDFTGTSPTGSITMDKPHIIHASWTTSYFQLYIVVGVVVVVAAVAAFLLMRRHQATVPPETKPMPPGTDETGESPPPEATSETIKCNSCGAEIPADKTYCTNCGVKLKPD